MIQPSWPRTPFRDHPIGVTRRTLRWVLGIFTAAVISAPSWFSLGSPMGQAQFRQHLADLRQSGHLLNILGEVSTVGKTTQQVVTVNQHIVSVLKAMNQEENLNQQLYLKLDASSQDLGQQADKVAQLAHLTADQIPLSLNIQHTTQDLQSIMAGVQQQAMQQSSDMQALVHMNQKEENLLQAIQKINQTILTQYLARSVIVTGTMAGK